MKYAIGIIGITLLLCLFPGGAATESEPLPDLKKIVNELDRLYRSRTSFATFEMTIINPNWQRTLQMEGWSEGMDKTFIHILSPKKDRGITTLRIDNEMWNYFPKINKVMKVPPSMMMGSWMGSDFTNDDLVKETTLLDDYTSALLEKEDAEKDYYYIELKPKAETASVWGRIEVKVQKADYIPVHQEYYDEKGKLMRVQHFKEVKEFSGRQIPAVMEMVPTTKEGHKTTIRYLQAEFDRPLPEGTFTLRNLQKRR